MPSYWSARKDSSGSHGKRSALSVLVVDVPIEYEDTGVSGLALAGSVGTVSKSWLVFTWTSDLDALS